MSRSEISQEHGHRQAFELRHDMTIPGQFLRLAGKNPDDTVLSVLCCGVLCELGFGLGRENFGEGKMVMRPNLISLVD
jgi:hypothetical protein